MTLYACGIAIVAFGAGFILGVLVGRWAETGKWGRS